MNRFFVFALALISCPGTQKKEVTASLSSQKISHTNVNSAVFDSSKKTIHVFVALCDNKYQGIVPVPPKIGNGQDLNNNLYWGCGYGVRSYFKNSKQWKMVRKYAIDSIQMERLIFKSTISDYYLVADAWNGKYIKECTAEFFKSCAAQIKDTLQVNNTSIGINGNASLLAYVGHDGLIDFKLLNEYKNGDGITRDAIMLACYSKRFFGPLLAATKANPIVWSSGLMAPEAYILHDAIDSYIKKQPAENVRNSAAAAYSKYQKCSLKAARNLLVTGW